MNNYKPLIVLSVLLVIVIVANIILFGANHKEFALPSTSKTTETSVETQNIKPTTTETMDLVVYLQDKDIAIKSDCGVTYPKTIKVQKTVAVADASLAYLFKNELLKYGSYQSVTIKGGVAKVTLSNVNDSAGLKISSLSSCESRHLFSVIKDTLLQYQTISSIELYTPSGKIEF